MSVSHRCPVLWESRSSPGYRRWSHPGQQVDREGKPVHLGEERDQEGRERPERSPVPRGVRTSEAEREDGEDQHVQHDEQPEAVGGGRGVIGLPSASAVIPAMASVTTTVSPVKEVQQRTREDQEVGKRAEEVRPVLRDEVEARDGEEPEECRDRSASATMIASHAIRRSWPRSFSKRDDDRLTGAHAPSSRDLVTFRTHIALRA